MAIMGKGGGGGGDNIYLWWGEEQGAIYTYGGSSKFIFLCGTAQGMHAFKK